MNSVIRYKSCDILKRRKKKEFIFIMLIIAVMLIYKEIYLFSSSGYIFFSFYINTCYKFINSSFVICSVCVFSIISTSVFRSLYSFILCFLSVCGNSEQTLRRGNYLSLVVYYSKDGLHCIALILLITCHITFHWEDNIRKFVREIWAHAFFNRS